MPVTNSVVLANSNGSVGIGTINPTLAKLQVQGNVWATSFTGSFSGSITSPGSNTQVIYNNSGVLAGSNNFVFNGANVGIGTTNPGYPLHVIGNAYADGVISTTFWTNNSIRKLAPADSMNFRNAAGNVEMILDANGNLGIGTTSPAYKLDVSGYIMAGISTYRTSIYGDASGARINFGTPASVSNLGQVGAYGALFNIDSNNGAISFQFGASEKVRITTDGNVGIGTTTVSNKLEVDGGSAAVALRVSTTNTGAGVATLILANSTKSAFNDGVKISHGGGYTNITDLNNSSLMVWDMSNARVGINTTSPIGKLQIGGTSGNLLTVGTLTNNWAGEVAIGVTNGNGVIISKVNTANDTNRVLVFYRDDTNGATIWGYTPTGGSGNVGFQIRANASSYFNGGNVGIGSTAPAYKLEVVGTSGLGGDVYTGGELGIQFGWTGSVISDTRIGRIRPISNPDVNPYAGGLALDVYRYSGTQYQFYEAVRFKADGNVGIGTTTPAYKLDVSGSGRFTSNVLLGTGTTGGTATPAYIDLGTSYSNAATRDKLKIYLYNLGTEQYGFSIGSNGDIQYHSNLFHDFYIANTLSFRINSTGNVGVGTSSPTLARLQVNGNVWATSFTGSFSGSITSPGSNTQVIYNNSGVLAGSNNFVFNGTNVGIGTTSTTATLTVSKAASNYMFDLENASEVAFKLRTYNSGSANGSATPAFIYGLYYSTIENATIRFYRGGSSVGGFLTFTTNEGTERMRITADGNVGIGSTAPVQKLQVNGSIALNTVTNGTSRYYTYPDANHAWYYDDDIVGSSADVMTYYQNFLIRYQDATNVFLINGNGNVGIGTVSPAEKLHVYSTNVQDGIRIDATTYPELVLLRAGVIKGYVSIAGSAGGYGTGTLADSLILRAESGYVHLSNSSNPVLTINGNSVGIGTTTPALPFHVYSGADVARFQSNTNLYAWIQIKAGTTGDSWQLGSYNGGLNFYNDNNSSYRVFFKNDGNVGIGTTAPAVGLHVVSNASGNGVVRLQNSNAAGYSNIQFYDSSAAFAGSFGWINGTYTAGGIAGTNLWDAGGASKYLLIRGSSLTKQYDNNGQNSIFLLNQSTGNSAYSVIRFGENGDEPMAGGGRAYIHYFNTTWNASGAGYWDAGSLATGTSAGNINFFVGGNNQFKIWTNSSQRFTVTGDGNVGIGTTAPAYKFHVESPSSTVIATIRSTDNAANGYSQLEFKAGTRFGYIWLANQNATSWGGDGSLNIYAGTGALTFYAGATQRVTMAANGAVRFNTYGAGSFTGVVAYNLAVDSNGNIIETAGGVVDGSGTPNYVSKWQDANTLTDSVIYDNGTNVGIGTTSPAYKFHVKGTDIGSVIEATTTAGSAYVSTLNGTDTHFIQMRSYGSTTGATLFGNSTNKMNSVWSNNDTLFTIGTIGATPLILGTSNTERMRLTSDGNVGIGSTSPAYKLDVVGDVKSSQTVYSGGNFQMLGGWSNSPFTNSSWIRAASGAGMFLVNNGITKWAGFKSNDDFDINGGAFFISGSNGNVGIGTATPTNKVHVYGGRIALDNIATNQSALQFSSAGTEVAVLYRPASSNDIRLYNPTGGDLMTWSGTNVGIGTTAPTYKLDVRGGDVYVGGLVFANENFGSNSLTNTISVGVTAAGNRTYNYLGYGGYWGIKTTTTGFNYSLDVYNSGTPINALTVLQIGGNVGIGTTAPLAKLHIGESGAAAQLWLQRTDGYNPVKLIGGTLADGNGFKITMNTTDAFSIYSDGNVGIGTTNPVFKFDVNAAASAGSMLRGTGDLRYHVFSTGTTDWVGYELRSSNVNAFAGGIFRNNASNNRVSLYNKNTEAISLMDTGNVGIGTTNPTLATLQVNGNVHATSFTGSFSGTFAAPGSNTQVIYNSGGVFAASSNFVFDGTNVGIGTTAPGSKLTVVGGGIGVTGASGYDTFGLGAFLGADGTNGLLYMRNGGAWIPGYIDASVLYINAQSAGSVGIGTTIPTSRLHVVSSNNTTAFNISIGANANYQFQANSTSGYTTTFNINDTGLYIGHNSAARSLNLQTNSTDRITILGGGSVGIGTTSPGASLQIGYQNATTNEILRISVLYSLANVQRGALTWHDGSGITGKIWTTYDGSSMTKMHFGGLYNSAYDQGNYLTIQGNGSIGIGTTAPAYKLDIIGGGVGTTAGNQSLVKRLYATTSNADYLEITDTRVSNGSDWQTAGFRLQQKVDNTWMAYIQFNGNNNGGISFGTGLSNTSATSISEKVRIDSSGNVGINTTSPTGKLHIDSNNTPTLSGTSPTGALVIKSTATTALTFGVYELSPFYGWLQMRHGSIADIAYPLALQPVGGNVGIGTTNPTAYLDVKGIQDTAGAISLQLRSGNSNANFSSNQITLGYNNTDQYRHTIKTRHNSGAGGGNAIDIYNWYQGIDASTTIGTQHVMTLDSGNVGIGTTTPNSKLHVFGGSLATGGSGLMAASLLTTGRTGTYDASSLGSIHTYLDASSIEMAAGSTNGWVSGVSVTGNGSTAYGGTVRIITTSGERLRVNSVGNVGINETSPVSKLTISNDAGGADGNIWQRWRYVPGNNTYYLDLKQTVTANVVRYNFSMVNAGNAYNNVLVLDRGNVGIGTTDPAQKLEIQGDGVRLRLATASGPSVYYFDIESRYDSADTLNFYAAGGVNILKWISNTNALILQPSSGNVGIGTTDPVSKLQIANNVSGGGFTSFANYQILLYRSGTVATSYGIGIESSTMMFNSDDFYKFYVDNVARVSINSSGTITAAGDLIAYGSPSDITLKTDIKPLAGALEKITKLQGVSFTWKDSEHTKMTGLKDDIGFIAQEVQEILPELVRKNDNGLLSLRDKGIVPYLVEAIKEQQKQIDELRYLLQNK